MLFFLPFFHLWVVTENISVSDSMPSHLSLTYEFYSTVSKLGIYALFLICNFGLSSRISKEYPNWLRIHFDFEWTKNQQYCLPIFQLNWSKVVPFEEWPKELSNEYESYSDFETKELPFYYSIKIANISKKVR